MKILSGNDCKYYKKSDTCEVYEYAGMGSESDVAIAKISGKYPSEGYCVNVSCREVVYIIDGDGVMFEGTKEHKFKKGDVIVINSGEKFRWDANCIASISCVPSRSPDQYRIVSE